MGRDITGYDDVDRLVKAFYRTAIPDPVLGPIFDAAGIEWDVHIPRITAFWEQRLLGTGSYAGNVVSAHVSFQDRAPFGRPELDRWLSIWDETVDGLFAGPVADLAKQRAHGAADVLERAVARRHLVPLVQSVQDDAEEEGGESAD